MTKKIIWFFLFCLLAVSLLAGDILYDNSRIVVRRQTVKIAALDPAFDGFTILQVSDLHSAHFGPNQERLVKLFDSLPYDMIAVNGDMVDRATENPLPFLEMLDNLKNKKMIFYVTGNVGPADLDRQSGKRTPFGAQIEEHGCILLDRPHMIVRGGAHIWISDDEYTIKRTDKWISHFQAKIKTETRVDEVAAMRADLEHEYELKNILEDISPEDVLIGLTHYPLTPAMLDNPPADDFPIYDLILSGHYHGGQIRIPFVGAIYLPEPSPDRWFPLEKIVSGFYQGKFTQQYISRGLGASSSFPYLNFRLFNPPEITLITLTS
jgi:uncharacterized protein